MARLSAHEKVERDRQIVADRASGLTRLTIAKRNNISERQAWEIVRQWRETTPSLSDLDPVELAREHLEQHELLIERLSLLAERATHPGVQLGALRTLLTAMGHRREYVHALGLLPRQLNLVRTEDEVRNLLDTIIEVIGRSPMLRPSRTS